MAKDLITDSQSLEEIVRQTRNLLAFHRDCGLNYPLSDEIKSFLQKKQATRSVPFSQSLQGKSLTAATSQISHQQTSTITLADINQELQHCHRCSYGKNVRKIIFGEGSEKPGCSLFIVFDPPECGEEEAGQPITGEARELLIKMLAAINLTLDHTFLTNIIKCIPPQTPPPDPAEYSACLPFLMRQIEVIQPKIIFSMGSVASQILLQKKDSLLALRGKFHDIKGIPLIATFSPSFLLRQPEMKKGAWQDLQMASKRLKNAT